MKQELPEWAKKMTDDEWAALQLKPFQIEYRVAQAEGRAPRPVKNPYQNCFKCGKRIILTLCRYDEPEYYCIEHCPQHKWQSDYDWGVECARCGISYSEYLEDVLEQHKIPFIKREQK